MISAEDFGHPSDRDAQEQVEKSRLRNFYERMVKIKLVIFGSPGGTKSRVIHDREQQGPVYHIHEGRVGYSQVPSIEGHTMVAPTWSFDGDGVPSKSLSEEIY